MTHVVTSLVRATPRNDIFGRAIRIGRHRRLASIHFSRSDPRRVCAMAGSAGRDTAELSAGRRCDIVFACDPRSSPH